MQSSEMVGMTAKYANGSEILFTWADITKDTDLNNIRGLEVTGLLFEEANQIDRRYFEVAKTRIGRWNNDRCPAFILLNLNPSLGWVKDLFYDNWASGQLPSRHYFLEFDVEDARQCAGDAYVDGLKDLAPEEYARFVQNLWSYSDVPNQLIRFEWYKQCIADEPEINRAYRGILAIDPAWEGDDDTVFGRMHHDHVGWFEVYPKQDPDVSGVLGVERAQEFIIKSDDVVVDPIGVGAAAVLAIRNHKNGFFPNMFIGGDTPVDTYGILKMKNKRSEAHWLLREALKQQEITITHHPEFQRQALAIRYSSGDKEVYIRPKKEIKADIKVSPGYTDVAMMLVHQWKTTQSGLAGELFERQLTSTTQGILTRAQAERAAIIRGNRIRE